MDISNSLKDVKDWLINKCRVTGDSLSFPEVHYRARAKSLSQILTPQNIPEFIIPDSDACRRTSFDSRLRDNIQSVFDENLHYKSNHLLPLDARNSQLLTASKSAPSSPAKCYNAYVTKSLPLSKFQTRSPAQRPVDDVFDVRLSQSAHTRRKESIFHDEDAGQSLSSLVCGYGGPSSPVRELDPIKPLNLPSINTGYIDYFLAPLFPFVSPSNEDVTSDDGHYLRPDDSYSRLHAQNRDYYRRRSSLVQIDVKLFDNLQKSKDFPSDSSFTSNSNKSDQCDLLRAPHSFTYTTIKRHSAPSPNEISVLVDSIPSKASFYDATKYGELKISAQYLPASKQLKATIIKAENLNNLLQANHHIALNTFVEVYLIPGKFQKRCGVVINRSSNPVYNQTFYFNNILLDNLRNMKLKVKVYHKLGTFSRRAFLGETDINMGDYDMLQEQRLWRTLVPKDENKELGFLHVSILFEPKIEKLHVTVNQARDLPSHNISGPPDVFVKIIVKQLGRSEIKKQTSLKKKTTEPSFKETFPFNISPKFDDLQYTSVVLSVCNKAPFYNADIIGYVILGYRSTEHTELYQWKQAMQNPCKEIDAWHYIVSTVEKL